MMISAMLSMRFNCQGLILSCRLYNVKFTCIYVILMGGKRGNKEGWCVRGAQDENCKERGQRKEVRET